MNQEKIEKNVLLLGVLTFVTVSIAGLVQLVPLITGAVDIKPYMGLKPYDALRLAGRDIYIREGCYGCHSQQVRPFVEEVMRYGPPSVAGEFVYDRPFQWGSKRTGPDLAREGGINSDQWQRDHLRDPRQLVPESIMPAYPFLDNAKVDDSSIEAKFRALRVLGHPYTDEDIRGAKEALKDKTEMDALVAYLQGLGTIVGANQYNLSGGVKK